MRLAALLALLTGCFPQYQTWTVPDDGIELRLVGMTDEAASAAVEAAQAWADACGKPGLFRVVVTDRSASDAVNVEAYQTDDGDSFYRAQDDRGLLVLSGSVRIADLAMHELGHALLRGEFVYDGDEHSADGGSVMHSPVLRGAAITADDIRLVCAGH